MSFLKTFLTKIGKNSDILDINMPSQFEFVIDDKTVMMTSKDLGHDTITKMTYKIINIKLKDLIDSDPSFKAEFDAWIKTVKPVKSHTTKAYSNKSITMTTIFDSSNASFVKAGTICGLSDLGFPDTKYIKGQDPGPTNHMNGVDDSMLLYTFDWPGIRTLIYLYIYYPGFIIGIMRDDHFHGN
jgi:hypothetical protein